MTKNQLGLLALVIAAFGLAIAVFLMKVLPDLTGMPPQHVAIWRFTIAAPVLWLLLRIKRQGKPIFPKSPWRFFILGLIFTVASFSAVFALTRLPSSVYVIIFYIYPSLVVLYALLTGGSVPRLFWLGLPMTLVGLVLTSFEFGSVFAIDPLGLMITLVNAIALAAYVIVSEVVFKAADDPLAGTNGVITGAMLVGLVLLPFLGISVPDSLWGWVLLVSFSIFGTIMPILALNIGVRLLTAARGAVIITVQPVMNILLAMVFLGESLTAQQWLGGGLVIFAVILLQSSPDRVINFKAGQHRLPLGDNPNQPSNENVSN